jgi:hypothetical protein
MPEGIVMIQIDDNIPMPKPPAKLPQLPLGNLELGKSFFVETVGESPQDQTKWEDSIRQKVSRFQKANDPLRFSVRKWITGDSEDPYPAGLAGMRVWRIEDHEQPQPTGASVQSPYDEQL